MIRVSKTVDTADWGGRVQEIEVTGHANSQIKDLDGERVCAAVSVLCTTLAAMADGTNGSRVEKNSHGSFKWSGLYGLKHREVLFFEKGIQLLADAYPEYLKLEGL